MQRQLEPNVEEPRDGLIEAIWETVIALAMVVAISVSVISLAAHLNEARTAIEATQAAPTRAAAHPGSPSDVAGLGVQATTRFE
jgi:hypothetical protein